MQYQLFNWMCLAIRMDCLNRGTSEDFDKEELFEQLKQQKSPYSSWPKRILNNFEKEICK